MTWKGILFPRQAETSNVSLWQFYKVRETKAKKLTKVLLKNKPKNCMMQEKLDGELMKLFLPIPWPGAHGPN